MIDWIDANATAIAASSAFALLIVTAFYAWVTFKLLNEAIRSRISASTPKVVAYLRLNEVHSKGVSLHIANLAQAAAQNVTAKIEKVTEWPDQFELSDSEMLRDISYLQPNEVLKYDLGMGPDLLKDGEPAVFFVSITFESIDNRKIDFEGHLSVKSVMGHGVWLNYGLHDIACKLEKISKTLNDFTGFKRLRVDTYNSSDRKQAREDADAARKQKNV